VGTVRDGKWTQMPIRYFITDRGTLGVVLNCNELQAAFASWDSASTAQVSSQFVGFTLASPTQDGATVIGFRTGPISTARSARRRSCSIQPPARL
jgi:hypothetical protein